MSSDHRMLRVKMKFNKEKRLQRITTRAKQDKYIDGEEYRSKMKEKTVQNKNTLEKIDNVQEVYNWLESNINEAKKQATKIRSTQDKKISPNTRNLISKRESLKKGTGVTARIEYAELDKLVKREIRKDIRKYEKIKIESIIGGTGSTRKLKNELESGKYWINQLKDKAGELQKSRTKIM